MNHKIKFISMSFLLILVACGNKAPEEVKKTVTEAISEGDYRIITPLNSTDARQTHVAMNLGASDTNAVGEGMMEYAKEYFSPNTYYVQEGQILNANKLQATPQLGDKEGLLGRKTEDTNPLGLNPAVGSQIPINDSTSIVVGDATIPIADIFEINFFQSLDKDASISGLALTIVLNSEITDAEGNTYIIEDKQLKTLGSEAARQMVSYLRTLPKVGNKAPIFIGLYSNESVDKSLPGSFIATGYGKDNIDSFKDVNEKWLIFPSEEAKKIDAVVSSQVETIRNGLFLFLPTDVALIAQGKFIDDKLTVLRITLNTQTKTYTENVALVQQLKELLANIENTDIKITVKINSNLETFAMILRETGSSESVIILF